MGSEPEDRPHKELEALLASSRQLTREMQELAAQLRKLAREHTALAKQHTELVEAMRRLKKRGGAG
jgi:prefoldin subunit 5